MKFFEKAIPPFCLLILLHISPVFSQAQIEWQSVDITALAEKFSLKESRNESDVVVNEYLQDRLQPIQESFKRINSITQWTAIHNKELTMEKYPMLVQYYYAGQELEKIISRYFLESYEYLTEYYLLNGQLSFVIEKSSQQLHANNQKINDDELMEDRSYFEAGKLIHQYNNQDCGAPFSGDYLQEEQKRITSDFEKFRN